MFAREGLNFWRESGRGSGGEYKRHFLAPEIWRMNVSMESKWGSKPCAIEGVKYPLTFLLVSHWAGRKDLNVRKQRLGEGGGGMGDGDVAAIDFVEDDCVASLKKTLQHGGGVVVELRAGAPELAVFVC